MQTFTVQSIQSITEDCPSSVQKRIQTKIKVNCKEVEIESDNESDKTDHSEQPAKNDVGSEVTRMAQSSPGKIISPSKEETKHTATVVTKNGVVQNGTDFLGRKSVSPENSAKHPSKSSQQSTSVGSTTTISGSKERSISSTGCTAVNGVQSQKPNDEAVLKVSTNTFPSELLRKKMKLSTVAKRVPLINTVGNQSKMIAMTYQLLNQIQNPVSSATEVKPASPSLTNSQASDTLKSKSILEARLTGALSNMTTTPIPSHQRSTKDSKDSNSELVVKKPISLFKDIDINEVIENNSLSSLKLSKLKLVQLFYEKGLTRLVAVAPRTVTMVDASTQVSVPYTETHGQEPHGPRDVDPISVTSAVSTESAGSVRPPGSSVKSQKKYVVVDTKNGKKVVAIPKVLLNNCSGPKKIVIEGKPVQLKADGPKEFLKSFLGGSVPPVSKLQQVVDSAAVSAAVVRLPSNNNSSVSLSNSHLSWKSGDVATGSSPILSSVAFVNCNSQLSSRKTIPTQTTQSTISLHSPTSVTQTIISSTVPHIKSKTLLPFGHGGASPPPLVPCLPNNANSLILPPNSSTKDISSCFSENVCTLPNGQDSKHPDDFALNHEMGEMPGHVCALFNKLQGQKRLVEVSPIAAPPLKKKCVEQKAEAGISPLNVSGDLSSKTGIQFTLAKGVKVVHNSYVSRQTLGNISSQPTSCGLTQSSDSVVNSNANGALNPASKEECDKFVRSAFTEFKNCLTFNQEGELPIHVAIERNDIAAVKRQCLVLKARGHSINIPNKREESPLQLSLYYGHSSMAKLLLQYDADALIIDHDGNSTLHLSVVAAEDALEALLSCGQNTKQIINCLNDEGYSALHLAAQHDKVKSVHLLTEHGASVDLPDGKSGRTALFHAAERKNYNVQRALVACGADMKEPTFTGSTPFLITRSDAISQLVSSGQDTIGEEIDIDTLLKSSKRCKENRVR